MKLRLLVVITATALFSACSGNTDKPVVDPAKARTDSTNFTTIQWKDSAQNLNKIMEGQTLEVVYHFTNTGDKPLVITDVRPGCGCTVAEKPAAPIMPGESGEIKAAFDSKGKQGPTHKTISVLANTKGQQEFTLVFDVDVEKKS